MIRGSAMYLFLFVLFRVVVRRRVGAVGMAEYRSVSEAFVLVSTLIAWQC